MDAAEICAFASAAVSLNALDAKNALVRTSELMMSKCHCVYCGDCNGTGNVRVPSDGFPEWDLESCLNCQGSGIVEMRLDCEEVAERESCI